MGHLNNTLKLKIDNIKQLEPKTTPEAYVKKLLKLKAKHFKKLLNPEWCELDLSQFEKLNGMIENTYAVLISNMEAQQQI